MRTPWYAICLLGNWRAPWSARHAAIRALPLTPSGTWVCRCRRHPAASWSPVWIYLYARRCSMAMKCLHAPNARHDENAPRVLPYSVSPNTWWYVSYSQKKINNIYIYISECGLLPFCRSKTLLRDTLEQAVEYCWVSNRWSWTKYGIIWRQCEFECALFALCDLQSYG